MPKYVISFAKEGFLKYTSHLDMLRLFKRAFRRADIDLAYSQGYNPHPKMGFAQPLSLGYDAAEEFLSFETNKPLDYPTCIERLRKDLPEGASIIGCGLVKDGQKSLAASVYAADYDVVFPDSWHETDFPKVVEEYLAQKEILVEKKQKKTKKMKEVDIRHGIRSIQASRTERNRLQLAMTLDCGSQSNISPELVITSFIRFASLECQRHEIEVCRKKLYVPVDFTIDWM